MRGSNRAVSHPGAAAVVGDPPSSLIPARADSFGSKTGDSEIEVLSIHNTDISCEFFPSDQLVRAFNDFKKSGAPVRILLFSEYEWVDLAHKVFNELKEGFQAGKTTLEVPTDGRNYLFDFLRMFRIDPATGRRNSIAWIDVTGRCFFPRYAIEERGSRIDKDLLNTSEYQRPLWRHNDSVDCARELDCESMEVSSACPEKRRWSDVKMLRGDEQLYKVVEKVFLSGIRRYIPNTVITSIHRCLHSSPRLSSFQLHKKATMETRGNANVKFGWYGTSASHVSMIMSYGFGQPNSGKLGHEAHGNGIHLSSPHYPYASALLSKSGDDGEKYVILCQVIMGKFEKVNAGSSQDHPSNEDFDSGVDDPVNPKWYVVWRTHMNTHILPEYIVSFRSSSGHSQGSRNSVGTLKFFSMMNVSFLKLFTEIGRSLPSSRMQALEVLYNQYKVGKIRREIFIRYLRSIAGDKLLISTIKRLRGY